MQVFLQCSSWLSCRSISTFGKLFSFGKEDLHIPSWGEKQTLQKMTFIFITKVPFFCKASKQHRRRKHRSTLPWTDQVNNWHGSSVIHYTMNTNHSSNNSQTTQPNILCLNSNSAFQRVTVALQQKGSSGKPYSGQWQIEVHYQSSRYVDRHIEGTSGVNWFPNMSLFLPNIYFYEWQGSSGDAKVTNTPPCSDISRLSSTESWHTCQKKWQLVISFFFFSINWVFQSTRCRADSFLLKSPENPVFVLLEAWVNPFQLNVGTALDKVPWICFRWRLWGYGKQTIDWITRDAWDSRYLSFKYKQSQTDQQQNLLFLFSALTE